MRRLLCLVGLALIATVTATGVAQAANEGNIKLELLSTDDNPCTNELVDSVVKIHIVITSTVNANTVSGTFHLNFSLKGVGQMSGAVYTGSEADNESFNASLENGRTVVPVVNRFIMASGGGGNNWVVRLVGHLTINANGEATASFEKQADEICR
jgi:hypothetical protein